MKKGDLLGETLRLLIKNLMGHKFNFFSEEFALKRRIELLQGFGLTLRMYEFSN